MDHSPNGPPQESFLRDRLFDCLWWLIFMGGVAGGTAAGVVLALWLLLPPLLGLLLIVACWLCGNVAGWRFAARLDSVAAQKDRKKDRRIYAWRHVITLHFNPYRSPSPGAAVAPAATIARVATTFDPA